MTNERELWRLGLELQQYGHKVVQPSPYKITIDDNYVFEANADGSDIFSFKYGDELICDIPVYDDRTYLDIVYDLVDAMMIDQIRRYTN